MSYIAKSWEETRIEGVSPTKTGWQSLVCPECSHDRKKKSMKSLSVNYQESCFNCNHCEFKGKVIIPEQQAMRIQKPAPKVYSKPEPKSYDKISEKVKSWFLDRKISVATLEKNKITDGIEKVMDKKSGEWVNHNCIQFNYFRDGELINVKSRDGHKNFKFSKDAELILYGLDDIKGKKEFVICEGEPDKLAWYEAGITYCVSVPNGAVIGTNNLQYMDNCWEYFDGIEKLYLSLDNDVAGQSLQDDIAARIGKDKCWIIDLPEDCKDANDVLKIHGKAKLKECFQNARQFPIEGIHTVMEGAERTMQLYYNGFPTGEEVGHKELDKLITYRKGDLTIITGIPGSGKGEFLDDTMIRLAAKHGWKFGIVSPENQPFELHIAKLAEKYIGESFFSRTARMNEDKMTIAIEFILEHFFFIEVNAVELTLDWVLGKANELVLRHGISGFVVDPWNRLDHDPDKGENETQYINKALTKVYKFKENRNIHFFLVAHPTKIAKEAPDYKKHRVPTLYDIAGSSHFFNKADNGVCVYRDFENNITTVHVQKIRWKFIGQVGNSDFHYEKNTGRIKEVNALQFDSFLPKPKQINLNDFAVTPPDMDDNEDTPF